MGKLKDNQSKYIALLLRHKPEVGGLTLDEHGWCNTEALVKAVEKEFGKFTLEDLKEIVRTDNKQRYVFNEEGNKIRANQGHSIQVDVELKEVVPQDILFHGTATRFVEVIRMQGLKPMSRLYVHLSKDYKTAFSVGKRHGSPFVFEVDAKQMVKDGFKFYESENGVILTKVVPSKYLK